MRLFAILALSLLLVGPLASVSPRLSPLLGATMAMAQDLDPAAFATWNTFATGVENTIADTETPDAVLEQRRGELSQWRDRFSAGRTANTDRIATLRAQIDALGPAPADGAAEATDLAARREELNAQLATLEVPGRAAVEAYSRADNLIRQIDEAMRNRQAQALLEVWPSPLNPANWPGAVGAAIGAGQNAWTEITRNALSDFRRQNLRSNLPLIAVLLVVAVIVLGRGRVWMARLTARLQLRATARGRVRGTRVAAQVVSLGQVVLPVAGLLALSRAVELSGMSGLRITPTIHALPWAGIAVFGALWLGGRMFPRGGEPCFFNLDEDRRREARLTMLGFGAMTALRLLIDSFLSGQGQTVVSVLTFPLLLIGGLLLFRFGQLLRLHSSNAASGPADILFRNRMAGYVGAVCIGIGVLGPILAAIGYVPAARALVYPAGMTLALLGAVIFLQDLAADVYAMIVGEEASRDALIPVLVGFALFIFALPFAALIWGARLSDLTEAWLSFRRGFTVAGINISPSVFLTFAVVFAIGYTATKLIQGALRSTILPKTRLDQGGQTAIIAGAGYIGIVLAAFIAITAAGIDLSSLAILAGALSVGIGFGLQNIVQNFVSGIILLIERPVSEGDWIEVGGVQGRVRAISVRSTRIETFDRNHVIVPNASLVTGTVTNWTRFNLSGRLLQRITVSGSNDGRHVQAVLQEIAEAPPMVILNPPPSVGLVAFDGGNLTFEMRLILRDVNFRADVQNEILHLMQKRFSEEGIVFGVTPTSKTIMADGAGTPYVLSGAMFQDAAPEAGPGPDAATDQALPAPPSSAIPAAASAAPGVAPPAGNTTKGRAPEMLGVPGAG